MTTSEFLALLNAATTHETINELLPKLQQIKCTFRQRQAILNCWQTKSATLSNVACGLRPPPLSDPVAAHRQSAAEISPPNSNSQPSTPNSQLTIEPVPGEEGRYFVQSRENDGLPYLVDMEEFNGNGWCGCKGFLHYIEHLETGAAPSPDLQCRHIKAVREFLKR